MHIIVEVEKVFITKHEILKKTTNEIKKKPKTKKNKKKPRNNNKRKKKHSERNHEIPKTPKNVGCLKPLLLKTEHQKNTKHTQANESNKTKRNCFYLLVVK